MKWFQHKSDSYTNIKLQELIHDHGAAAYGMFWFCCELVAQQGKDYKIGGEKSWKKVLSLTLKLEMEEVDLYLKSMARSGLINKEDLEKSILSIPKMEEYSDDYTKRHRRKSEQGTDSV